MTENYPKTENVLKNKILDTSYELLKYVYEANIYKEEKYMKMIIVDICKCYYGIGQKCQCRNWIVLSKVLTFTGGIVHPNFFGECI